MVGATSTEGFLVNIMCRVGGDQNLLENTKDKELTKMNLMLMVQYQIDRQASNLQSRTVEDPEFADDLRYLVTALASKLEDIR